MLFLARSILTNMLLLFYFLAIKGTKSLVEPSRLWKESELEEFGELECGARRLAFDFLPSMQSKALYEALRLSECESIPFRKENALNENVGPELSCKNIFAVVPANHARVSETVFTSLKEAISASRRIDGTKECKVIKLLRGYHFVDETIRLNKADEGLQIIGESNRNTWISGGRLLAFPREKSFQDDRVFVRIRLPDEIKNLDSLFGLNPHKRFQRARWPNGNTETDQWGYASPKSKMVSNSLSTVEEWIPAKPGESPQFIFINLTSQNPTNYIKDDSTQVEYNSYTSGRGGICDSVWETSYSSSYWCGNASSGGWAEVDKGFVTAGRVGLPIGMRYAEGTVKERALKWASLEVSPAVIHVWHPQSWFTNMLEIVEHNKLDRMLWFGRGGSQGGRSWCQCDQCTYVARSWCQKKSKDALISGNWYIENIFEELDTPGEYFFKKQSRELVVLLNKSDANIEFVTPILETLISVENEAKGIQIRNIGFRDSKLTYLNKHGVPSGGDWSLYKGAAVMIANSAQVLLTSCRFRRLDGTAVLLLEKTRDVQLFHNEFSWIGESAIALWGKTDELDGTKGTQPRGTQINYNVVREIGIYQKQSSAVFLAKSMNTTIFYNTFYNMPRAAINFNDGFGGGNTVKRNLIFNTCRESGDHGAINSWDRQPFLYKRFTDFAPAFNTISKNFIFANYGASQGIDNDDGSSFYNIFNNVFYAADGFKMDYGGHDSRFASNLIITLPYDGANCFGLGSFKPGHQHAFYNNRCIIMGCRGDCGEIVGSTASCMKPVSPLLHGNMYFTKKGNASIKCGSTLWDLPKLQRRYPHLESDSSRGILPSTKQILLWMAHLLGIPSINSIKSSLQ